MYKICRNKTVKHSCKRKKLWTNEEAQCVGKTLYQKSLSSPKLICSSNTIPIKIPRGSCSCTRQGDYKCIKKISKEKREKKKKVMNKDLPCSIVNSVQNSVITEMGKEFECN